jgi:hypothetical protein
MRTFFWGYFSKPWKRLFRTVSVLIIIFFSFFPFITDHPFDFNIVIYTLYLLLIILLPIPILSYVIEPFVLKNKGGNNYYDQSETKKEIELEPVTKSEVYEYSTNQNIKKKSNFKNYFSYNNEYLTGINYLIRMIIGSITIPIFFIGLLILSTSVYKRTSSLGFGKSMSIINCILIPILCILTIMINYTVNKFGNSSDPLMSIIPLIFSLIHMILVFKNGTRKSIGKFQTRE